MYALGGHTVLYQVLSRAKQIQGINRVILAAPDHPRSTILAAEARTLKIETLYGSETDVLERYFFAALNNRAKIVMRITADCPLIEPLKCQTVLESLGDFDYVSNAHPRVVPKGHDCEVFTMQALTRAYKEATDLYDREHVTPWMQKHLKTKALTGDYDQETNFCLDTAQDYLRLQGLFA
jgi:spore coat polysaccharide biosynthesis protein SpsF (cytidylyltransferase family)